MRRTLALALAVAACGLPEPQPVARVEGASPSGAGVPTELAEAFVRFSAPVEPAGLEDGARLVLAPAAALREAIAAVESDVGAAGLAAAVPAEIALEEGGRRAALRPRAPLRAQTPYALVLSSRLRAAGGGAVLDPDGRRRTFVAPFETGAAPGPPPRPVITEVRAHAASPEAGGEYVELANRGTGAFALAGLRLAKRTTTGALSGCDLAVASDAEVPPGELALVVGGAYDGRYAVPPGVPVVRCGAAALLGGLANDRAPELVLLDATGVTLASFGAGGVAPICPAAIERIDPEGPDVGENLRCADGEGTPGW